MTQRTVLILAACFGALAVSVGAFGAHALKDILLSNGRSDTYELAVRYQFYHTFAMLAVGILWDRFKGLHMSVIFFASGIVIFSGSLYTLSLTNQTWWGAVTPIGGLCLIGGWLTFLRAVLKT